MTDARVYEEVFNYLSSADLPESPEPAIVFGRNDPLVARKLGDLIIPNLVTTAVITGGVGKDTGALLRQGFRSEAHFLEQEAQKDAHTRGYDLPSLRLDEKAANGRENAHNGLSILSSVLPELQAVTAVAHATSARRLSEQVKFEAGKLGLNLNVHRAPTDYSFDTSSNKDRDEAANELLRLADWPSQGELGQQDDIPQDFVDFVRERHGDSPRPMAQWQSQILRLLPKRLQLGIINFAAKHDRK